MPDGHFARFLALGDRSVPQVSSPVWCDSFRTNAGDLIKLYRAVSCTYLIPALEIYRSRRLRRRPVGSHSEHMYPRVLLNIMSADLL